MCTPILVEDEVNDLLDKPKHSFGYTKDDETWWKIKLEYDDMELEWLRLQDE